MAWVSTSPLVKTYTLEEFWQLSDPPDRSKLELIAGVLYMTPPPEQTHDTAVKRINRLLTAHSAIYDRNIKADTYGALGAGELWLVDEQAEALEVRRQIGNGFGEGQTFRRGDRIVSPVLPDLGAAVDQTFTDY